MNIIPLTGDTRTIGTIGTAADRGCVRCQEQARPPQAGARTVAAQLGLEGSDLVLDDRGRYWHARCAAITLAEFTRFLEDRGAAYYYERTFELTPAPVAAPEAAPAPIPAPHAHALQHLAAACACCTHHWTLYDEGDRSDVRHPLYGCTKCGQMQRA